MVEMGHSGPIPYPSQRIFWRKFFEQLTTRYTRYVDPIVMVVDMTNFRGRIARVLGTAIALEDGFFVLPTKDERDHEREMFLNFAKAVAIGFKFPFEQVEVEHGLIEFLSNKYNNQTN